MNKNLTEKRVLTCQLFSGRDNRIPSPPSGGGGLFSGILAIACVVLAAALLGYSLTDYSTARFYSAALQRCEKQLHEQQQAAAAAGERLCAPHAPAVDDRYISAFYFLHGQLQSWTTRDIAVPEEALLAIDTVPAFVRLGHSWYVAQARDRDSARLVTAVLIKRGYSYENDFLHPRLSPFLAAAGAKDVVPASGESPHTLFTDAGKPLFTLVFDYGSNTPGNLLCRWLAMALLVAGLFAAQHYFSKNWTCTLAIVLLGALRYGIWLGKAGLYSSHFTLFFPSLYADSLFIPSLGSLLLHALFLFFMAVMVVRQYKKSAAFTAGNPRWATIAGIIAIAATGGFIHYAWRSLIINATIPLQLSQLDLLTGFTFIAYGVLVLLFATLFLWLYICARHFCVTRYKLKMQGYLLGFIFAASLYTLITLGVYGHQKENLQIRAWAGKLALEHDPAAELCLHEMAAAIADDQAFEQGVQQQAPADSLHQYLLQRYFQGYMQHYDLQLTICPYGAKLRIDGSPEEINCRAFFAQEIEKYGTPLNAVFYHLANDNGRNSYLGRLPYLDPQGMETDVFLEIDSKLLSGGEGYPELLQDKNGAGRTRIPAGYSYAKYAGNHLVAKGGSFPYLYGQPAEFTAGEKIMEDGYTHFLFYPHARCTVVISRAAHTPWGFLILLSYLFFVFGAGLAVFTTAAGIPYHWRVSKNTFRRKIAMLLIVSFIISILCTAVGTVFYNIHRFRETAMAQMSDKMQTVLTQLDYLLSNADTIYDTSLWALDRALVQCSNSMMIDVNIYDENGQLVTSSRPEVFEKQLQSERINRSAFEVLAGGKTLHFVHKERIGNLSFYSVYATYHNVRGNAIAYVNIPYFSKRMQDIRAASAIITAIINVYILALVAALLLGTALANRLLRPLQIVRHKMQALDVTKKMEYIAYHKKDELGDLVRAYNQMLDALEESARKLAQSERESAWREMARQIAHEIKNPLTPMRLSIQHLVRLKKEQSPAWQSRFDELAAALLEQIDTLAKTASEFSNFAKVPTGKPEKASLNALLDELKPLFTGYETIRFEWHEEAGNACVNGHADQLSRVLVNLLTNAVQAVQHKPDGKIAITLSEQDDRYFLRVEDNGDGVKAHLQSQLFTPDFTTKNSGSGLGLAISKKIMEQEGGSIAYAASPLGGACFTVSLPKAPQPPKGEPGSAVPVVAAAPRPPFGI